MTAGTRQEGNRRYQHEQCVRLFDPDKLSIEWEY